MENRHLSYDNTVRWSVWSMESGKKKRPTSFRLSHGVQNNHFIIIEERIFKMEIIFLDLILDLHDRFLNWCYARLCLFKRKIGGKKVIYG